MKLRNKKTGKVLKLQIHNIGGKEYNSLAEINEEWEDYEEPKDIWWLDNEGNVNHATSEVDGNFAKNREIGNYFKTKEEAEKAVERLRAWKRLKDKGFRFVAEASYVEEQPKETRESMMFIACTMNDDKDFIYGDNKDLKLLFGGEE